MTRQPQTALGGVLAMAVAATAFPARAAEPSGPQSSGSSPPSAAAVLAWTEIAETILSTDRGPGPAEVLMAIVEVAIYDTVVAFEGGPEPYQAAIHAPDSASADAAVAATASTVLLARAPEQAAEIDRLYSDYLAMIPDDAAREEGIAIGTQIAEQIVAARADGLAEEVPYEQPEAAPGVFEPVADGGPIGLNHGQVEPFALASADQFRPDGPDPLGSGDYAAELAEVRDLGRLDSELRTPAQTETALFYSDNGFVQWSRALRSLAEQRGLDADEAARLLAMTHVAAADAGIACFEAKYHYLYWRPVHAIQRADTDTNAVTDPDPTWEAQLTANHPEYPAGAACVQAAITATVAEFFGSDDVALTVSSETTGTTRTYARPSDALAEVLDARVWQGLHFRNSVDEGAALGYHVAEDVAEGPRAGDRSVQRHVGVMRNRLRVAGWALDGALCVVGDEPEPAMDTLAAVMAAKREIADAGIEVCDLAMEVAGGSAFFRDSPIERAYRDMRGVRFHPFSGETTLLHAGRLSLGLPCDEL